MLTIHSADARNNGAYHLRAVCSGVRLCGYADESMRTTCDAYDRVEIERFDEHAKKLGRVHLGRDIQDLVKKQTEE